MMKRKAVSALNMISGILTCGMVVVAPSSVLSASREVLEGLVACVPMKETYDGSIIIGVKIDGHSWDAIVDSGLGDVPFLVSPSFKSGTAISKLFPFPNTTPQRMIRLKSLTIGGEKLKEVEGLPLPMWDMPMLPHLMAMGETGSAIILGSALFRSYAVRLDFPRRELQLLKPGRHRPGSQAISLAVHWDEIGLPCVSLQVGGRGMGLVVDTGCQGFLGFENLQKEEVSGLGGPYEGISSDDLRLRREVQTLGELQIGPLSLRDIPAQFWYDYPWYDRPGKKMGLVGYWFLKHFVCTFDLSREVIYLEPRSDLEVVKREMRSRFRRYCEQVRNVDEGYGWLGRGEYEKANKSFDQALRSDPESVFHQVAHLGNKGNVCLGQTRPREALKWFERMLKKSPFNGTLMEGMGRAYSQLSDQADQKKVRLKWVKKANTAFEKSYRYGMRSSSLFKDWGINCFYLDELDRAVDLLEWVLELEPNHEQTLWNLGRIYLEEGEVNKTKVCWDRLKALNPDFPGFSTEEYQNMVDGDNGE